MYVTGMLTVTMRHSMQKPFYSETRAIPFKKKFYIFILIQTTPTLSNNLSNSYENIAKCFKDIECNSWNSEYPDGVDNVAASLVK